MMVVSRSTFKLAVAFPGLAGWSTHPGVIPGLLLLGFEGISVVTLSYYIVNDG